MKVNKSFIERKKCIHTVLKFSLNNENGNNYLSCKISLGKTHRNIGTAFKVHSTSEINSIKEKYFSVLIEEFNICNSCRGFGDKNKYELFLTKEKKEGQVVCEKCNGLGVHK